MDKTLQDALTYVLALVELNPDGLSTVQDGYGDDRVRDLLGATAGVLLGVFGKCSEDLRKKIAAGLRFSLTGDETLLDAVKPPELGGYL